MYYDRSRETDEEDELAADPDWPLEGLSYRVEEARAIKIRRATPSQMSPPLEQERQPAPLPLSITPFANAERRLSSPTTPTASTPGAYESRVDPIFTPRRGSEVGKELGGHI